MSHHHHHGEHHQHGQHHHDGGGDHHHHDGGEHHHHDGGERHHHQGGEPRHHQDHQGGGDRPGPRNVDLELSQLLGDRASSMTRELFVEVLRDAIKDELRKLPELQALVAQAARELSEDMRLSLQIEELIAQRDKRREGRKADLLEALLAARKGEGGEK